MRIVKVWFEMINSKSFTPPSIVVAAVLLVGCNSTGGNLLEGERIDYQSASKKDSATATLEVPPDLTQISRDNRFAIPGAANAPITASGYNAQSAAANSGQATKAATTALNFSQGMRIERDGSQRWLLVKQSPEVLWPKIKDFWQENGFLINKESQATGVMETDWAENRAKIPQDFLRRTLGKVLDSLYSTGERDKFRTRLERRADGSTEIYISHQGAEEVLVGAQKSTTMWTARPNDPDLEAIFLTRLMVSLGEPEEKAKQIIGSPLIQPAKAKLASDGMMLEVDEGFDRAWRRVGLALDRVGFTVEDRDRSQGIYFVRYIDQDEEANKPGLLTRLLKSSDKEANAKRYRILVKGEASMSHVTVQNNEGHAEKSAVAKKILNLLLDQLK